MITLDHISFSYGSQPPVLKELSLTIAKGESVCLMGGNGCGKSTLALIIAGLLAPKRGTLTIELDNASEVSLSQSLMRPVGILFQNPDNQMVAVTVEKEIAFALENLAVPMSEMEQRVSSTLARFGIDHLRKRLTTELSGGEKQRVALASVMVCNPPIIVLDEPDSFLDRAGKLILEDALGRMHASNPDLVELRITQYPDVARTYRRLIVMHGGAVIADGDPSSILDNGELCERAGMKYIQSTIESSESKTHASVHPRSTEISVVRLKNVAFSYMPDKLVIENFSLEWRRGETIGLIGPSGSGKSTIGSLLCGLLKPLSGEIILFRNDNTIALSDRFTGAVVGLFQQPERQFFLPTCGEEIAFGPKNVGIDLSPDEVAAHLRLVGLEPSRIVSRDPFSLSMGEKRRLAFAAILSMQPSFVVFDEPTCGLDPEGVGRFVAMSRTLKQSNVGQVIISHDDMLVGALSDRVFSLPSDYYSGS